jgi:hypothetical protein
MKDRQSSAKYLSFMYGLYEKAWNNTPRIRFDIEAPPEFKDGETCYHAYPPTANHPMGDSINSILC